MSTLREIEILVVDDDRAFYGQWNNPEQPRSSQPLNRPSRKTTPRSYSCAIRSPETKRISTTAPTIMRGVIESYGLNTA